MANEYEKYLSAKIRNIEDDENKRAEKNRAEKEILEKQYTAIKEAQGNPISKEDIAEITGDKENAGIKALKWAAAGANSILDKFQAPARTSSAIIIDKLASIKKALDSEDPTEQRKETRNAVSLIPIIGPVAKDIDVLRESLENKESISTAFMKLGAKSRETELASFVSKSPEKRGYYNAELNDLGATLIGDDNWTKVRSGLDNLASAYKKTKELRQFKVGEDTYQVDLVGPSPIKKVTALNKADEFVMDHLYDVTDLAYQTAVDPLTYTGIGLPIKLGKEATNLLYKGFMKTANKIPGFEKTSTKLAEEMANTVAKTTEKLYSKYPSLQEMPDKIISFFDIKAPAMKAAKKIFGEDAAKIWSESIEEAGRDVKRANQILSEKIKGAKKKANIVSLTDESWAEVKDLNHIKNDIAKSRTLKEWDLKVAQTLQKIEQDAGVYHANFFKDELKDIVGKVGSEAGFTGKELNKLKQRISVLRSTKSLDEIDDAGKKVTIEYAKDLEEFLSEAQGKLLGKKGKAFEIAKDRRDAGIALVKGNYKTWKRARQSAVDLAREEEKNLRKSANSLIKETSSKYTKESKQVLFNAQKQLNDNLKAIRYAKIDPKKKSEIIKNLKTEFDSFTNNFEKASQEKLASEYGNIVGMYQDDFNYKVKDFLTGVPDNKNMVNDYKKSLKLVESKYEEELKILEKNISGINFAEIYNKALTKYKGIADNVFEKNISDLDEGGKMLAREIRQTFDEAASREIAAGMYDLPIPEYYARITKNQPFLEFDPDAPMNSFKPQGTGAAFKKSRLADMYSYKKYSEEIAKKGGKAMESSMETALTRDMLSRVQLARQNVWNQLPDELKVGKDRQKVLDYIDYVFTGRNNFSKIIPEPVKKAYDKYSFYNKTLLTAFSLTFYFRNITGYPFLAANEAGMGAFNPKNIGEFLGTKFGAFKEVTNGKVTLSGDDFFKEMYNRNVTISSFARGGINQDVDWVLNNFSKKDPRHYIAGALHAAQTTEDFGRMYAAFTLFKQGKSLDEAAKLAKKAMYTFDNFNVVDKTLGGLMTFYSFKRKNLVGTLKSMMNNPGQYSLTGRVIDKLSQGQQLSDSDKAALNEWDKDKLIVLGDIIKGAQTIHQLGFTPFEDVNQTLSPLYTGDWFKFFDKNIWQQMAMPIQMIPVGLEYAQSKASDKALEYVPLPREYQTSQGKLKLIGKISRKLTGYDLIEKDVIRRVNGVPVYEKQYKLPEIMVKALKTAPWSRVEGDYMRLLQSYSDKTGKPAHEVTIIDLIGNGSLADPAGAARFIAGINSKVIDFNYLKNNKDNAAYFKLKKRMEAEGLLSPYGLTKETKARYYDKLKEIR